MSEQEILKEVSIGKYNNNPVISLPDGSKFGFTFGVKKAKVIMDNLEHIKKFIEDNDNTKE